jgi:Protein of unknown function (DUF3558)
MRTDLLMSMIAAGSVIALASCGTGTDAFPESAQSGSTQAASPIPMVKNPRDVAAMALRPCELLTVQQATEFGLDLPPQQLDGLFGTLRCEWTNTSRERETLQTVNISMFTNNPTLEVAYGKDRGLPLFELSDISGYPAIITMTNADQAICDIKVKPAELQSVSITYYTKEFRKDPQQSCEVGKQVAAAVLTNLPPKS